MREIDGIIEYDFDDVKKGLADGSVLLVDVREPNEWAAGHIPGAVLVPLSTFDPTNLPATKPGQTLVFACRSGGRTVKAIMASHAAGLPHRSHYRGSFLDWEARGGPIAR